MEQFEKIFAAAVFNAKRDAAASTREGVAQTASDMVEMAIIDLRAYLTDQMRRSEVQNIIDRYVEFDANGDPQPRSFDLDKVVSLR